MKISQKAIDIAKRGACTLVASILIAIPYGGNTETEVEDIQVQTKQEQTVPVDENGLPILEQQKDKDEITVSIDGQESIFSVDLDNLEETQKKLEEVLEEIDLPQDVQEYPSFILVTHWEKTENYSNKNDYSNGNREYKRTAYRFKANENFNVDYFENDISKMIQFFRDDSRSSEVFDIIETYEQVATFSPEMEKSINIDEDIVEIEGSNLRFKINSKSKIDTERMGRIAKGVIFLIFYLMFAFGVIKNWHRLG